MQCHGIITWMPIPRTLNHDFFKKWSPEMAYVLGFFAADGNMIRNRRGGHFIAFYNNERSILRVVRRALLSNHKIAKRKRIRKSHPNYQLQIGSKVMFEDLCTRGFVPRKSKRLRFPMISKVFLGDFVRGYFDGDGCVYFRRLKFADRQRPRRILMTLFTCGTRSFLADLHSLLKSQGVVGGTIRNKKRGFDLALSFRDSLALYKLMYNTASVTGFYLPRKYNVFRRAIKTLYPMRA